MKKLPLGIQSFRKIIEGGYVYVDKTRFVYDLINDASYYFLSRPRRFGKSLLLDTIGEAFSGNKELFEGLWIYGSDYAFDKYPVIRIDMSNIPNETSEILKTQLVDELISIMRMEGFDISGTEPGAMFKRLIEGLYVKYNQRVVVLIDEYDKPILDHIGNAEAAEANRLVLRGFYGILKSMDPYLRFTFLTGVSKFTKTSVFSELNNLIDITLTERYANICGIAAEDLGEYFCDHIDHLRSLDRFREVRSIHDEILAWYDGYSWDGVNRVINPFSLLSFFGQERFGSFWYSSGTPKFLIDLIKGKPESYVSLKNLKITEKVLDNFDIKTIELEPLLFQTGYLTVKRLIETGGSPIYQMDIPNFEVREAFTLQIVASLTESGDTGAESAQFEIRDALEAGDLQGMLVALRRLFASIPYEIHVPVEAYYHSIFYASLTLLGFDMDVEVSVSTGRVDAILELEDKVYIMEFKYENCPLGTSADKKRALFDKALDDGMEQIRNKGYHSKFIGSGKTIYFTAFAFLGRDEIEMRVEEGIGF